MDVAWLSSALLVSKTELIMVEAPVGEAVLPLEVDEVAAVEDDPELEVVVETAVDVVVVLVWHMQTDIIARRMRERLPLWMFMRVLCLGWVIDRKRRPLYSSAFILFRIGLHELPYSDQPILSFHAVHGICYRKATTIAVRTSPMAKVTTGPLLEPPTPCMFGLRIVGKTVRIRLSTIVACPPSLSSLLSS